MPATPYVRPFHRTTLRGSLRPGLTNCSCDSPHARRSRSSRAPSDRPRSRVRRRSVRNSESAAMAARDRREGPGLSPAARRSSRGSSTSGVGNLHEVGHLAVRDECRAGMALHDERWVLTRNPRPAIAVIRGPKRRAPPSRPGPSPRRSERSTRATWAPSTSPWEGAAGFGEPRVRHAERRVHRR